MKKAVWTLFAIAALSSCVSNRSALDASQSNRLFINQVAMGQTMDQVRIEMHKGPESQNVTTLGDGTIETVWNYVTDYNADTNTSITFHGDKVSGINQTRWLGNGDFSIQHGTPEEQLKATIGGQSPAGVIVIEVVIRGKDVEVRGSAHDSQGVGVLAEKMRSGGSFQSVNTPTLSGVGSFLITAVLK